MTPSEYIILVQNNCKHDNQRRGVCENCKKSMQSKVKIILFEEESIWINKNLTINFNTGKHKGTVVKTRVNQLIWWDYATQYYSWDILCDYEQVWNKAYVSWKDYPILELTPITPLKKPGFSLETYIENHIRNGRSFSDAVNAAKIDALVEKIFIPFQSVMNLKV